MERHYETICVIKSDIGDAAIQEIVKKATGSLEKGGAEIYKVDEWGRRRLAYPIEKKNEGFYVLLDYTSTPEVSKELERSFKISEDVMRYQTVRVEAKAAVEAASDEDASAEAAPEEGTIKTDPAVSNDKGVEAKAVVEAVSEEDASAETASEEGTTKTDPVVSDDKGGEDD